jgi:hypothetical protein
LSCTSSFSFFSPRGHPSYHTTTRANSRKGTWSPSDLLEYSREPAAGWGRERRRGSRFGGDRDLICLSSDPSVTSSPGGGSIHARSMACRWWSPRRGSSVRRPLCRRLAGRARTFSAHTREPPLFVVLTKSSDRKFLPLDRGSCMLFLTRKQRHLGAGANAYYGGALVAAALAGGLGIFDVQEAPST